MLWRVWLLAALTCASLSSQTVRHRGSEEYEGSECESEHQVKRPKKALAITSSSSSSAPVKASTSVTTTSLFKLNYDTLAYIFTFAHDPYSQYPLVCKMFHSIFKLLNPITVAKIRFPSLNLVKLNSRTLALKLMSMDDNFFKSRPELGTSLNTYLGPDLTIIQERTMAFLRQQMTSKSQIFEPLKLAFLQAMAASNIQMLAELINITPVDKNAFEELAFNLSDFNGTIYPLYLKDPKLIEKLSKLIPLHRFLHELIIHPVPASFLLALNTEPPSLLQAQSESPVRFFTSSSWALAWKKRADDDILFSAIFYARNLELIRGFGLLQGKDLWSMKCFEFLNNFLYKPDFSTREACTVVNELLVYRPEEAITIFEYKQAFIVSRLLICFVRNDNLELFMAAFHLKRLRKKCPFLIPELDSHPDFAKRLYFTTYASIVGKSDPLRLARFRELKSMTPLDSFTPRTSRLARLRILATEGDFVEFFQLLKSAQISESVKLLKFLVKDLDDPAELFFQTLDFLIENQFPNMFLSVQKTIGFWEKDMTAKLFKSLLLSQCAIRSDLKIPLDTALAEALIDDRTIASLRETPRYKELLKILNIDDFHQIQFRLWTSERLVALFEALHFPISFRYSKVDPSTEDLIENPSYFLILGPENLNIDILPCLAIRIAKKVDLIQTSPYMTKFRSTTPPVRDPLLLNSFALLNLWRLADWESFFLNAPCFKAFYPQLGEVLVTKYYRQYLSKPQLFDHVLNTYNNQAFNIPLRSQEEALEFILTILPKIPAKKWKSIRFSFLFDYRTMLELEQPPATEGPFILESLAAFNLLGGV